MSGIMGVLDLRGAPADVPLLRRMTASMTFRGPEGHAVWADGPVGLGHTLLQTAAESAGEQQPCTLDGRVWITADARIDDRRNLAATLESMAQRDVSPASDAHLILYAYKAWGDACVDHLLGDFAFAIWDGPARRLFCARDRFGVKPFYYACVRGFFVFSNTLECVRLHPAVGDTLNDRAIGDFLVFGSNEDPATTTFADVRRLPPAHSLTVKAGTAHQRRYWTLPGDGRIRYSRSRDYVDHFIDLLRAAVDDRLRSDRVGIWMSGGLDSTSIAATATQLLSDHRMPYSFHAYSIVYDQLLPDVERPHAGSAAQALGIPIHYFVADGYAPFDGWERADFRTPEPACDPFMLVNRDQMREAAAHSRVLLCGDGGDETLIPSPIARLLSKMPISELATGIGRSLLVHRERPNCGVRSTLRRWIGRDAASPPYPVWLNKAFEDRFELRARWARLADPSPADEHPLRPDAYRKMTMPLWPSYFESWDPGVTRVPVEARYPFLDVRLVEYLMAIPPIPWCVNKRILRESMRSILPNPIRRRPKTPLAGDPLLAHVKTGGGHLDDFEAAPELARYIDRSAIPPLASLDYDTTWLNVRPLCLNHWLKEKAHHAVNQFWPRQGRKEALREPAACRLR